MSRQGFVRELQGLVFDSGSYRKPVEVDEDERNVTHKMVFYRIQIC